MQANPSIINMHHHKELYGFDQAREFNKKEMRTLFGKINNSKKKTLRTHRIGR